MRVTPHSPWYLRKQTLSTFKFTERIKEVPSMVLNGHEVNEGIKLVKGLPDSQGAIVREHDSSYSSFIMADMNPAELKCTVVSQTDSLSLVGIGIGGSDLGALHPASVIMLEGRPYLGLGTLDLAGARVGSSCLVNVTEVSRVHEHKKIKYNCALELKELLPSCEPSYIGNLDVLVSSEQVIESDLNIGDYVTIKELELIGQILNIVDEETIVIWQTGEVEEVDLDVLESDLSMYPPEHVEHMKKVIQQEKINLMNLPEEEGM